ncbi:hypothetical protein ACSYDW_14590 [Paeniglutamicibacter sp. R2-26]|uniref:hypothetical protein n=1 Tax=Paeniglutamicibacter sp. R2-26 TaxID=3144417 RepID=UPI003EE7A120
MTSRVFQFNRQQGSDPNPTQFFQRVNAFAAGFKPDQPASLLMVHHGTSIGNYLILHSDKIQESAALPLAHAVAAHLELGAQDVFDARAILTNAKVLGHVPYWMRAGNRPRSWERQYSGRARNHRCCRTCDRTRRPG